MVETQEVFEMTKEDLKKRLDGYVRIGKLVAGLIGLYYLFELGYALLPVLRGAVPPLTALPLVLQAALGIAVIVLSLSVLFGVGKTAQPFTPHNARLLRWIGVLLVVYEPLNRLIIMVYNRLVPPAVPDGLSAEVHSSMGLILVAVGFAVMAISYVFEYGAALQQLDDETL